MTAEQLAFLTTQAHLEEHCTWSLQQRVDEYHERYPGSKMNRWKLAAIYGLSGVKRKVVKKRAGNPNRLTEEARNTQLLQVRRRLEELNAED